MAFFVKEFWEVIVPNPLIWNWHMQVLCDEIQQCDERVFKRESKLWDLCVNVPPGTSKTLILSVFSTCWEFARMPSIKVFVGSFSDAAVAGIADQIKLIMRSEKYQLWFPEVAVRRDRDALHNFKTTVNGEFYAFTVGGTITSKHADILKVDDPLNPKEAATDAGLKAANDFFSQTLPSRKVDKMVTPTYLVMQRLHVNDPSGTMISKKGGNVRHICLPAQVSNNVRPKEYAKFYIDGFLDPVRLGPAQLKELKIDLGAYNYAGQIDQQPVPAGGIIWQKWFMEVEDWDWPEPKWGEAYSTDWDLAYTEKETNAASAYITTFKYKNKIWIDDFGWDWLEFPALIKWMKTKRGPHYIEAKASGKSAKQTLVDQGVVAVEVPVPGGSDKEARARMATPIAEAGMVCIRKSMAEKLYNDSKQGILFFPRGQFADMADVLAQCLLRQRTPGNRAMDDKDDELDDVFDPLEELDY